MLNIHGIDHLTESQYRIPIELSTVSYFLLYLRSTRILLRNENPIGLDN